MISSTTSDRHEQLIAPGIPGGRAGAVRAHDLRLGLAPLVGLWVVVGLVTIGASVWGVPL